MIGMVDTRTGRVAVVRRLVVSWVSKQFLIPFAGRSMGRGGRGRSSRRQSTAHDDGQRDTLLPIRRRCARREMRAIGRVCGA